MSEEEVPWPWDGEWCTRDSDLADVVVASLDAASAVPYPTESLVAAAEALVEALIWYQQSPIPPTTPT